MTSRTTTGGLEQAYAYCREVAKTQAKNFYYSFRVLPKAKSDAMCAVYAFMRRADDISDDETKSVGERRVVMAEWIAGYRAGRSKDAQEDMVFRALRDTQERFGIGDELLEQLVQGTAMDLEETPVGTTLVTVGDRTLQAYETFGDLYGYCYLVASVVGLVCIRIFGYSDPSAELLAERTGIAFQLTNILRDVKEDAERGRIYLPQETLASFEVTNEDVVTLAEGRAIRPNEREMIGALSARAWEYYGSAQKLLPLIDGDSRAALWVLVDIYSRVLQRIDARHGDVFTERVRVPTRDKLLALAKGGAMALRQRVS
jgi:phytoene synthase